MKAIRFSLLSAVCAIVLAVAVHGARASVVYVPPGAVPIAITATPQPSPTAQPTATPDPNAATVALDNLGDTAINDALNTAPGIGLILHAISPDAIAAGQTGTEALLQAGAGTAGTDANTAGAGGPVVLLAGAATVNGTANAAGGDITLTTGAGVGTGRHGYASIAGLVVSVGTAPAVSNTSANSCGTTAATIAGTDMTGVITVGATSGTSCTLTFTAAAPTRRQCWCNDETTSGYVQYVYLTTTTGKCVGTFTAADKVSYGCSVY